MSSDWKLIFSSVQIIFFATKYMYLLFLLIYSAYYSKKKCFCNIFHFENIEFWKIS